jgi:hypothetical protein
VTEATSNPHRTPLLERVMALRLKEEASAIANLASLKAEADEAPSLPLCLELMAEVASLVFPHQRLIRLQRGEFSTRAPALGQAPIVCRAERRGDGVEANLFQQSEGAEPLRIASASVQLADSPGAAVKLLPGDEWALDRRGRTPNADELYAARELTLSNRPGQNRVIQWAAQTGLGNLVGGLGPRGPHFGLVTQSIPLPSSPGVIEALCQLVQWQWYALAGEGARVQAVERIEWYRIPRPDEELVGRVSCRGSIAGAPCFDAVAYGSDRKPALELHGVRVVSHPLSPDPQPFPRLDWESFVRVLGGLGHTARQ